jgi:hypothetical protein
LAKGFTYYHKGGVVTLVNYWGSTRLDIYNDQGSGVTLNYWVLCSDKWLEFTPQTRDVKVTTTIKSPITVRKNLQGALIWEDDFEDYTSAISEKWKIDGTVTSSTDYPLFGKYCAKATTGVNANDEVVMRLLRTANAKGRIGLEINWMSQAGATNLKFVKLIIQPYDGVNVHTSAVRWLGETNKKWQYSSDNQATWTDITDGAQNLYVESEFIIYHNVALVIDSNKDKFVKLICDGKTWDLSSINVFSAASTTFTNVILASFTASNAITGVSGRVIYIDDFSLTEGEP